MKSVKKILKITSIAILLLLISSSIYIYTSGPTLPKETDEIIEGVLKNPLPEIVKGKTGFAKSQGLDIWYESISPKDSSKGAILLIMGISNDALGWPQKFIQSFVDSGYQVIRYDHRATGMSDWVKNWDSKKPYFLADMADNGNQGLVSFVSKTKLITHYELTLGAVHLGNHQMVIYPHEALKLIKKYYPQLVK